MNNFIYGDDQPQWFKELDKTIVHIGGFETCYVYAKTNKKYVIGDIVKVDDLV